MPTNQNIQQLFAKYLKAEGSVEANTLLFKQIAEGTHDDELARLLDAELEETDFEEEYDPAWEVSLKRIKTKIAEIPAVTPKIRKFPVWGRIAGVAAVLLFAIGIVLYQGHESKADYAHLIANDIPPGKIAATLTLANGRKISLSKGSKSEIVKELGISISKTADGQIVYQVQAGQHQTNEVNTLSTAIGQTYRLILPDQTQVWLNAASSLTYSSALTVNGIRKVKLSGEAYFEVAKDKAHPFIVESGTQAVEVLGTHFNVNAYPDEKAYRTTLLEGSVKITDHAETRILKPGNQAINKAGNFNLSTVDTEFAVAWKSNNFVFDRLDIKEIMKMIARWYNVEVIYKDEIPPGVFWGSVSRFDNISKVLIPLEATGNVHFKIEGRTIYVFR